MATRTVSASGGNFTDSMTYDEFMAPTAADDVVCNASSGNLIVDAGAVCRSLDCNGYTATLSGSDGLSIGDGTAGAGNRALRLSAGMSVSYSGVISFVSTSGTQQTITTAGQNLSGGIVFNGAGGSWSLADALTCGGIALTAGSFTANNQTVTATNVNGSNSNTRSLTLGTGLWTISGASVIGGEWNFGTTTNLTFNSTGSTIRLTDTSGSVKQFTGGGLTYNIVQISAGGAGTVTFTGSNTFAQLARSGTGTKTIRFTAGTTTTLTGGSTAFFSGTAGNLYTVKSVTDTSAWNLSKSSGTIESDYLSIRDSAAAGGATFYAGANSTNVSGNSGWTFTAPPSGKPTHMFHLMMQGIS